MSLPSNLEYLNKNFEIAWYSAIQPLYLLELSMCIAAL